MLVVTYASMSMRLPSTILKSAVYLLLGASAVFRGAAANALTFNWSFLNELGNPNATGGIASGTITGLDEGINDLAIKAGIAATMTSSTSGNGLTVPLTWSSLGQSTGIITIASGSVAGYDFIFNGNSSRFGGKINNYAYVNEFTVGIDQAYLTNINFSLSTPVPAPLPILGLPAVFFCIHKLRKRIKASREASSASLV